MVDADVTAVDDLGTAFGWTFALSALMISAAWQTVSLKREALAADTDFLCHTIHNSLQMRSGYHRKDTSIYHSEILCTPNPQMWVNYTALLKREHRASATRMEFGSYPIVDDLVDCILVCIEGRYELRGL